MHDPIRAGLAAGWKHIDAATLGKGQTVEADVVIVGSGAGGGVTADILSASGLRVILVEEGPLRSSSDFRMLESEAYPELYQDSAARKTMDKAINILQGRCVGGSTTVNWTSSFRTPPEVFAFWQRHYGLRQLSAESMSSWFAVMEHKLWVRPWETPPNQNNKVLAAGGEKLGIPIGAIKRNVKGCWNLGYCGMGCPTNAKQSMLLTTIPAALNRGATLYTRLRAERLRFSGGRISALDCVALRPDGIHPSGKRVQLRARHFVAAAGAIGSPALLLRSGVPDPHRLLGKRTFLHPVVISSAVMPERVDAYAGAPQTLYSDFFLHQAAIDGPLGFKLETPPLHPVLYATTLHGFGAAHAALMREFTRVNVVLALLRDGFHAESQGGQVRLGRDGLPVLDYPLGEVIWEAARRALLAMAEIQFAAGARAVTPVHETAPLYSSWAQAKKGIAELPLKPFLCRVVSAHVMGGCGMADAPQRGVTDHRGRHFWLGNLSIHDGSLFPTSLGANPQLSIYGLVARNASLLAAELSGRPPPLIP
ncbi:GMC family oxidoreductase [Accumulibacter sp.]|uniref:GMC family oxidoreductase n=1 Tax=Accumulibacter sp. TaxID=2053492 RepID=UPI0025EDDC6F|nr:GMC family oxidoreductase [Accumulibacter sp.]MCM8612687.1 GMC family oxidoreductase [Accumulibacter sp.]MCM8636473.1 GMC family oxidoreductase [Accumulibacter sp.]MCM8639364.1 GMC family oxidoreductase [Accumulibacter sp.]